VSRSSLEQQTPEEATQLQPNAVDMSNFNLEPIEKIIQNNADVKGYFLILFQRLQTDQFFE